ncbi:MAG TPA: hypothetical protein VHL11_25105, partial [Phototrophicaceae bacterium]|nr:hypothetical protein [Phototrophicaceae bacterium]
MIFRRLPLLLFLVCFGFISVSVIQAAPVPDVQLDLPEKVFIGDKFEFSVIFDNNSGTDNGFGPFIDLWLPRNGADGNAGTDTPDGITFLNAKYLDAPVNATTFVFPSGGCVNHPLLHNPDLSPVQVCGTSGDQLVVLELPFGSFTASQPAAEIVVKARVSELADLEVPLQIRARGGFRFGQDPLDNPCCDAPIISPETNGSVTPVLMTISKSNDAPESEIPAGPNFQYHWTILVDVANGQTITDLTVTDYLPPEVTYVDLVDATPPLSGPPVVGGGNVAFPIASVMGSGDEVDVSIEFTFYADEILDPTTGESEQIYNSMDAIGTWAPPDSRDAGFPGNARAYGECTVDICPGGDAPVVVSFGAQKHVEPLSDPVRPGTVLEYTIDFELSDFYVIDDVILNDIISDGQHLDPTFTPHITFTQHGVMQDTDLNPANYDVLEYWTGGNPSPPAPPPAVDGDTVLRVRVTDQVGSPMLGGCIPPGGTPNPDCDAFNEGATKGKLVYRTVILDQFVDDFPSGDPSVDDGDLLTDEIALRGQLLNPGDFTPGGYSEVTNGSQVEITLERGELTKTIFAVNGMPCGACADVIVNPGDTVTYRIRQELFTSDFEVLRLVDFLPLPVFNAAEVTTFNYTIDPSVPPAGTAKFFTGDTLYNLMQAVRPGTQYPIIQVDAAENTVTFGYGDEFDDPLNRPSMIDVLFTVTVTNQPFADGLALSNLVQIREGSTNAGEDTAEAVAQIHITAPLLLITKGIVASSNPSGQFDPINPGPVPFNPPGSATPFNGTVTSNGLDGNPINSDMTGGVAVGDILSFAIVIENTGSSSQGAFDIQIQDTLSPGYGFPDKGLNLQARLGNGVPVGYQPLGSSNTDRDLFDQGIELTDPGVNGACGPYAGDTG